MRAGRNRTLVTLSNAPTTSGDSDGFYEPLDPADMWAGIVPMAGLADGRTLSHLVTMRYHAQVTMDTRIVLPELRADGSTRELFVKGVQNVGNRNIELQLICEEVLP